MKAVIFDMDGVIIDSEPIHFYVDQLVFNNVLGMTVTHEYLEKYVGMTNPDMWRDVIDEYGLSRTIDELIDYQLAMKLNMLNETDMKPINGIPELLKSLSDHHIPMGIASSSPRPFIECVLNKFNILEVFDVVVSGEEVPNGKPAPDVYLEAASTLDIPPSECVVIEDARNGVTAAKRAGMKCVGYQNPNSGNQDLSLADKIVQSLTELSFGRLTTL